MISERIEFPGNSGDMLTARLDKPVGAVHSVAILAHCFTCSKDLHASRRIAQQLTLSNMAVLRFDFTGLGHSQGEFANTNFTSNVADLVLAAQYLQTRGLTVQLLIGHSFGGSAVIKAAPLIGSVKAVVTIGAPAEPEHVLRQLGTSLGDIQDKGEAEVLLAGRPFAIRQQFVDDVRASSLSVALSQFNKRALLILHAPTDSTVAIDNAAQLFMAAKHPKSFVTLDDADHLVSRPEDAEYVAGVIAAWARRYLHLPQSETSELAPEGVVRVHEADSGGFAQDIDVGGRFRLLADEPKSYGGTDFGPSPYQLLSAGLGACTGMTIRMYARRKHWPLTDVKVDIRHNKRHIEACAGETVAKQDHFQRTVYLYGELTAEQRQQLLAIADKCPVHKTLHGEALVTTELGASDG